MSLFGLFGPPDVDKLKAKRDVTSLIKALAYQKDSLVRWLAAEALGNLGDARAVEPLIAALKDSDSSVRQRAAEALGKLRDTRAVEPLITALKDRDSYVRQRAADALDKIGAPAIELFITALKDSDSDVRQRAAEALWQIGDARAVEPLIAALKDSDSGVRRRAAEALYKLRDARAVEPLIAALKDSDSSVRQRAAEALWQIGDARALEFLLNHPDLVERNLFQERVKVVDQLKPLLEKMSIVDEQVARICGEVYHDAQDLFVNPFDGPVLMKANLLAELAASIAHRHLNDVEVTHTAVRRLTPKMYGNVLVIPEPILANQYCIVRVKEDGFLLYTGTVYIRPSAGSQRRIPVV